MDDSDEENCTGDDSTCEEDCSECECYLACHGEYPWDAANAEYERSRGV